MDPPLGCKPIRTKWLWKNKKGEKRRGGEKQVDICGARV
jgi:hypothetical protein